MGRSHPHRADGVDRHLLDVLHALNREYRLPASALRETVHLLAELADPITFIEVATGRTTTALFPTLR